MNFLRKFAQNLPKFRQLTVKKLDSNLYCCYSSTRITNQHNLKFVRNFIKTTQLNSIDGRVNNSRAIQENISSLQLKKRPLRKKRSLDEHEQHQRPGIYNVIAYATAEDYDLDGILHGLEQQNLYETRFIENADENVLYAQAKYRVESEPREIFFFREGSVVLWNISDLECGNILNFLKQYEQDGYSEGLVQKEVEYMNYQHNNNTKSTLEKSGDFVLNIDNNERVILDKYTFSNAMVLSVKLGIWEALLERYIDTIEFVTEDLKMGRRIRISREDVLRKHGELFTLRHLINLSSDLLDTPDFYWDNEELEQLYLQVCNYFCISKRTRVMNEKINHCVELMELLSTHLNDKHHTRLEWMIIILIMVEVAFETIHYIDKYV